MKTVKKYYDFKNDVVFKFSLCNEHDPRCIKLLKIIIEGVLDIKCDEIHVLNPDLFPKSYDDKEMILDLRVKTSDGEYINVEMQNSSLSDMLLKRFDAYGCKLINDQISKGKSYSQLNKVNQIIFINDMNEANDTLIDIFTMKNQRGRQEKSNLITRAYIYMPYINLGKEYQDISKLNDLELAVYVFKNGFTDGIISLKKEVIDIMKDKLVEFNEDDQLRDLAYNRELLRMQREGDLAEASARGKAEGEIIGEARGKVLGETIAKANNVLKLFKHNFPDVDTSFLEGLTSDQYDLIFDMLLEQKDLDTILQAVY